MENYLSPYFDESPFETLPPPTKDELMRKYTTNIRHYPKNTTITLDPQVWTGFYLYKGCLKVFISNDLGIERLLFYLAEKNTCSCGYPNIPMILHTTEDCDIYFINTKQLLYDLVYDKKFFSNLWESSYRRLGIIAERLLDISGTNNKGKVCNFLYNLAQESHQTTPDGKLVIKKLPTRNDLALFIGSHKSNVIKILSALENDGIITPNGKGIIINDLDQLKTCIDESCYLQ